MDVGAPASVDITVALIGFAAVVLAALIALGGVVWAQRQGQNELQRTRDAERQKQSADARREARDEYLGSMKTLTAALEVAAHGSEGNIDDVKRAYAALAASSERLAGAFGRQSTVVWVERRIRAILDGGRLAAIDAVTASARGDAGARDELLRRVSYFPMLADYARNRAFAEATDAAIGRPDEVVRDPVADESAVGWLEETVREFGGHPIDDPAGLPRGSD
jgi:hypothetical protein